jgi:hypothetical protein
MTLADFTEPKLLVPELLNERRAEAVESAESPRASSVKCLGSRTTNMG